jgi:hypothetical protein
MTFKRVLAGVATCVMGVVVASTSAPAQGVAGTALGAPEPGRFALGVDLGIDSVQFSRLRWGERFTTGIAGDTTIGPVFDNRPREGGIVPALSLGWGLPGGLFGQRAEIYGRFAFTRANSSESSFIPSGSETLAVFQFVAPMDLTSIGGAVNSSGANAFGGNYVQVDRTLTSYDGWIGGRLHMQRGSWAFSPMVEIGYQRLNQEDSMGLAGTPAFPGTGLSNLNDLGSDYYRIGIGLGVVYPLSMSVSAFGVLRGSLDVVHHDYDGTTTLLGGPGTFTSTVQDSKTQVSGRGSLRAGLAFTVTPGVVLSLSGNVAYIGSVPYVVYGTNSPIAPTGIYSGAAPAHIATQGQLNFGLSLGGSIRF